MDAKIPKNPNPLLGWTLKEFNNSEFIHSESNLLAGRRPVLLYGDSFGMCLTKKCFQHYFNNDLNFSNKCFLINYSVGGYGLDQIYLTYKASNKNYKRPLIIFSLMTEDLDRATQAIFRSQKPYFVIEKNQLTLKGVPISNDLSHYIEKIKPFMFSYLGVYLKRNLISLFHNRRISTTDKDAIPNIVSLGKKILQEAILDLKKSQNDFLILVFVPDEKTESAIDQSDNEDWRLSAIKEVLKQKKVNYLITKDIIRQDMINEHLTAKDYFIPNDGHPNDRQNELIVKALQPYLPGCR